MILTDKQKECLGFLAGISRLDDECYPEILDDELREVITTSKTGMYIDQDEGISSAFIRRTQNGCACLEEFTFSELIAARDAALVHIINQTALSFANNFEPRANFWQTMGGEGYSRVYTPTNGTKSVFLKTNNIDGGVIKISAIGLMVRLPQNVSSKVVTFAIKKGDEVLKTYEIEIEMCGNGFYKEPDAQTYDLPAPIILECDGSTYEVSYNYDGTYQICENEFTCGCSAGRVKFGTHLRDTSKQMAYGMRIKTHFNCDNSYILCSLVKNNTAIVGSIAQMIIYKTLAVFIKREEAKRIGKLTSLSLSSAADLAGMGEAYEGLYLSALDTILNNRSIYQFNLPCFSCRTNKMAQRQGILF